MLFPEHSVFFEMRLQLEMNISLSVQHTAVGFPEPEIWARPFRHFSKPQIPRATFNYLKPCHLPVEISSSPTLFLIRLLKDGCLSFVLHSTSLCTLGWNHPRISETSHLLWPLAIWTHLIYLVCWISLPSGQDPSFPQLFKSQGSDLGGS